MVKAYDVQLIAIGNGTASRETEHFVADLIKRTIVSTIHHCQ